MDEWFYTHFAESATLGEGSTYINYNAFRFLLEILHLCYCHCKDIPYHANQMEICLSFNTCSLMLTHVTVAESTKKMTHTFSAVLLKCTCASCTCACLPRLMESTLRPQCKYYLAPAPVCSSDGATVVSEPSSAPGSSRACSSAPPCAPSPATQSCAALA